MPRATRRDFLKGASVAVGAVPLVGAADGTTAPPRERSEDDVVEVSLEINGEKRQLKVLADETLGRALREQAGLTGTKLSCEGGACGACTVHVDGRPMSSCLMLAADADGRKVDTIEGLGTEEALHPVQQAFLDADALQCGFCTPGMVMSAVAFYDRYKGQGRSGRPSRDEVNLAMAGNLCRCGAQPGIIEAVTSACAGDKARPVGGSFPDDALLRVDGVQKVTGRARYAFDRYPKGTLYAAILFSPWAHAKVRSIRLDKARRQPGVKAAIVLLHGGEGEYVTVRYSGQALAAVCAKTRKLAERALDAIVVDADVLAPAIDPEAALRPGAPVVYPGEKNGPIATEIPQMPVAVFEWEGNRRGPMVWPLHRAGKGDDVLSEISSTSVRAQIRVKTDVQVHAALERNCAVADYGPDEDGQPSLTMYATTQTVQVLAADLAEYFELPRAKVRVLAPHVGGGFGAKTNARIEHLAAARLSRIAGAPVRLELPPHRHLTVSGNRPGTKQTVLMGADDDGNIRAVHHTGWVNCGTAVGERVSGLTSGPFPIFGGGHYEIPAMFTEDINVTTHAPPGAPFRAPGYPPSAFALEQAVDEIAHKTGQDPIVLRRRHTSDRRKHLVMELAHKQSGMGPQLRDKPPARLSRDVRFYRGVGVGTAEWVGTTAPSCRVEVRAHRDGHVEVSCGSQDMGQGTRTVLASVVRDVLDVPIERISVRIGDSRLSSAPGSYGSITTGSIAPPAKQAAEQVKQALRLAAMVEFDDATDSTWGVRDASGQVKRYADLFHLLPSDPFVASGVRGADATGFVLPPGRIDALTAVQNLRDLRPGVAQYAITRDWVSSVQIADVEVDVLLGQIRVRRVFVALDAGKLASPITARSQVIGGVQQGVSRALYEGRVLDEATGRQLTADFDSYAIIGIADAPDVDVAFLERNSENNPYGSLGLGENSTIATCSAVANAFFRATGVRMSQTPMTPARVLAALKGRVS